LSHWLVNHQGLVNYQGAVNQDSVEFASVLVALAAELESLVERVVAQWLVLALDCPLVDPTLAAVRTAAFDQALEHESPALAYQAYLFFPALTFLGQNHPG
jgi:hypothetical protein